MADEPIYTIQPNPFWYFANNLGLPLAPDGFMFTYRSLNKTEFKFAYQDAAGLFPWTDPIPAAANGTFPPIFWKFDPANPDELYYIRVCKSNDPDDLLVDFDGISGSGSGGGSVTTTALDLENLIANNVMYRNIGTSATPVPFFLKIAPGAHTGLAKTTLTSRGPDICFVKNPASTAIDTISFISFNGTTPLSPDVTPAEYLNYTCSNSPINDDKSLLFPVTQNVQNLAGQTVSITLWANLGGISASNVVLNILQFFGDGIGASTEVPTPVASITVTGSWTKFGPFSVAIPSIAIKTIGGCHNDALFLQVVLPSGLVSNINITKPAIYLGEVTPEQDYHTYDMIESEVNDARTGDIRISINDYQPFGWVAMNDGSIGNPSSGATNRANFDTFPLYNQIWNSVSNSYAPVVGGRGATSVADFTGNKAISLTRALGRVFAGTLNTQIAQTFTTNFGVSTSLLTVSSATGFFTGVPVVLTTSGTLPTGLSLAITYYAIFVSSTTIRLATSLANALVGTPVTFSSNGTGTHTVTVAPYQLGQPSGAEMYALSVANLAPHTHTYSSIEETGATLAGGAGWSPTGTGTTSSTGSATPFSIIQPTTYMNTYIKL